MGVELGQEKRKLPKAFFYLTGTLLGLALLASVAFLGMGGKVNVIETPSMATYAPVGSLVLTMPADYETLEVGDPILFNVAGGGTAYFHRIASVESNGLSTKGDLNGTIDPWLVTADDVLGKEVFHAFGLGYLLKMAPVLVLGSLLIYVTSFFYFPGYWKVPVRILGGTLLASLVNYMYRPFVDVTVLSQVVDGEGTAVTQFVTTGLWRLEGHAFGGTSQYNVYPGQIGVVESSQPDANGQFSVSIQPHTEPWVWALLSVLWLLPLLAMLAYFVYARVKGLDLLPEEPAEETTEVPAESDQDPSPKEGGGKGHTPLPASVQ